MGVGTRVGILLASSVIMMFVIPLFSVPVAGDGLASRYDTARDAWYTLAERDQFCIINYDDGIEKMIVQIQLDGSEVRSSEKIAWLFPIPALPESVSLRHFQIIPRFDGYSLGSAILEKVADSNSWSYAFGTQLYTVPALAVYYATLGFGSSSIEDSVESFAVLNQYGVTTEVLAVDSSEALGVYLTSKELALPEEAELAIEDYLDGDYSFVLSWVSSVSSFLTQAFKIPGTDAYSLGIGVEFPCDGIFFPLEMTSAYGTLEIPITVQVLDHVTPDEYPSGGNLDFSCKYRVQETFRPTEFIERYLEEFDYFFAEQIAANDGSRYLKSIDYTVVSFDGPAGELTEDLWLSDSRPLSVSTLHFVGDNPWLVTLAVLILVSCISSLIACVILFGWNARLTRTFILLGVANIFSIIGYYFAYDLSKPILERENVDFERKGWRLVLLFSAFFIYQLGFVYFLFFYSPTVGM
jgi:hypothetical protein